MPIHDCLRLDVALVLSESLGPESNWAVIADRSNTVAKADNNVKYYPCVALELAENISRLDMPNEDRSKDSTCHN